MVPVVGPAVGINLTNLDRAPGRSGKLDELGGVQELVCNLTSAQPVAELRAGSVLSSESSDRACWRLVRREHGPIYDPEGPLVRSFLDLSD